ncbi:MAG: peptidyl-alpha-hydroxyglycine alpha-amidating lyase family protein [Dehalococcoidia bacterium]
MNRAIVGTGEHLYQVIHPFGTLPAGMTFGNVSHVATDSADRVYAFQRRDPPVLVLDRQSNLVGSWGSGLFLDAHGIFITPSDEVFLIDRDAHEVLKFNTQGEVLLRIGTRERPSLQGPFNHPADLAVAPSGELFIADGYGNSRVHRFSAQGELINSWGSPGAGPGEFTTPHGIWVDPSDRVYVCDRENNRVQIFNVAGEYLAEWRDFYHPMDIYRDSQGTFYVTDQIPRITMLNAGGELVARGRTPYNGHGMWIDSQGDIYLAGNAEGLTKLVKVQE